MSESTHVKMPHCWKSHALAHNLFQDVDIVTTAAVIIWLRRDFMSKHDEWEMIEMKALSWLKTKLAAETDLTVYLEEIHKALWSNGI